MLHAELGHGDRDLIELCVGRQGTRTHGQRGRYSSRRPTMSLSSTSWSPRPRPRLNDRIGIAASLPCLPTFGSWNLGTRDCIYRPYQLQLQTPVRVTIRLQWQFLGPKKDLLLRCAPMTENWIEWQSVILFWFPSTVTVTDRACIDLVQRTFCNLNWTEFQSNLLIPPSSSRRLGRGSRGWRCRPEMWYLLLFPSPK